MILTLIQARSTSSRLPGKVFEPILGQPMLARQIERVRRAQACSDLVVVTSTDLSDQAIVNFCHELALTCFLGSLDDVLDRFYQAALPYRPAHIIRLTGDCPLTDPALIDSVVDFHLKGGFDYTSNCLHPTFPDGLDVEICSFKTLQAAWQEAKLAWQREHVTPFIHQQPERFKLGSLQSPVDHSSLRWTVDEPEDMQLIKQIYEALYPTNHAFTTGDILAYLDRKPELKTINTCHVRNEGLALSIAKESSIQATTT